MTDLPILIRLITKYVLLFYLLLNILCHHIKIKYKNRFSAFFNLLCLLIFLNFFFYYYTEISIYICKYRVLQRMEAH